jgi:beta-barrel assembly-enhancing protease
MIRAAREPSRSPRLSRSWVAAVASVMLLLVSWPAAVSPGPGGGEPLEASPRSAQSGPATRNTAAPTDTSAANVLTALRTTGALATAHAQDTSLPDLGYQAAATVSDAQERALGRRFLRHLRRHLTFVEDPEVIAYTENLGYRLVAASGSNQEFRFFVIEDPTLNAFAVPGGLVFVHTGLFLHTRTESELAGVVGHEIAHVTQRHIARMIARSKEQTIPTMGAVLAAILLSGQAGAATLAATQAAVIEDQLRYSRTFEQEADALGIQTMARAGFDPQGMADFFERMQQAMRIYESAAPEFLRTHPLTFTRVAEARARADRLPSIQPPPDDDFAYTQARIRALLSGTSGRTDRQLSGTGDFDIAPGAARPRAEVSQYEEVLRLRARGEHEPARERLASLLAGDPDRVAYHVAAAEIEMSAGDPAQAVRRLQQALERIPDDPVLRHHLSEALITDRQFEEARREVRTLLRQRPDDHRLHALLSRAAAGMDLHFEAHQALAEHFFHLDDLESAIEQIRRARDLAGDSFFQRESATARLTQLTDALEQRRRREE